MDAGNALEEDFRQNFVEKFGSRVEKLKDLSREIDELHEELSKICFRERCLQEEGKGFKDNFCIAQGVKDLGIGCCRKYEEGDRSVWINKEKVLVEKKIEENLEKIKKFEGVLGVRIVVDKDLCSFHFDGCGLVCLRMSPDFWVEKSEPSIKGIKKLIQELNETEDLTSFLNSIKLQMKN